MPDYTGPMDEPIGRAADHEFACDDSQASIEIERGGSWQDAEAQVAKSVVALVKGGSTIGEAARACGQTIDSLRSNSKARQALLRLKNEYELDAEEMKLLVKTTAVEMAITGEGKEKLDAIKLIAQMPDVGLSGSGSNKLNVAVGVFSDETKKVLASIDPNEKD